MLKGFEMDLLKRLAEQYLRAKKKDKSKILSQYQKLTSVSRGTAQKRFSRFLKKDSPSKTSHSKKGRKKIFRRSHEEVIRKCWELAGNICAEKLHPMLPVYIEQLAKNGELKDFNQSILKTAASVSLGTLKRIVATFPKPSIKRYKGNHFIYQQVPIIADFGRYAMKRPGFFEVDFVEHNGGNSTGIFAITGIYTDLYSQWTVRAAGLGKNLQSITEIDRVTHTRIPMKAFHYHPDNDKTILKVLFERMKNNRLIKLSRSRPYKKNDNAHVEQKGGDKVRKLIGYWRFDTPEEVRLLNEIYKRADLLDNLFIPTLKLKKKLKDHRGKTIKKIYESPKTPYQRLMQCKYLTDSEKEELRNLMESVNMVKLKKEMDELIKRLIAKKLSNVKDKNSKKYFTDKIYDLTRAKI